MNRPFDVEPCVSGCGCDDFTACYCDGCPVSPTFDREGMALFHDELVAVGIARLTPEQEARAFDAVRQFAAEHTR